MTCSRAAGALLLLGAFFSLAACDNPTDVGGELVGGEGADPQRVVLPLDVDTTHYAPETGTSIPGELGVARFLAGRQEAAGTPFGDVETTGYIDFQRVNVPADFQNLTIDSVNVELVANYAYGDTTQPTHLSLHDLTEEWDANNAPADTTFDPGFAEGQPITTFTATSGDTLTVSLPQDWILEHRDELSTPGDSAFAEAFHGFQVRAASESGVIGFASSATRMRVVYEPPAGQQEPEATYSLTEQLTTVRSSGRAPADQLALIQDGTGRALSFELNPPDSLRNVAVNNAELIFEADTTVEGLPGAFHRPQIRRLELRNPPGEEDDESDALQRGLFLELDADSSRFETNFALRDLVQDVLNGTVNYGEIQVRPPPRIVSTQFGPQPVPVPSLNSALIRQDVDRAPRLELLYTPLEDE